MKSNSSNNVAVVWVAVSMSLFASSISIIEPAGAFALDKWQLRLGQVQAFDEGAHLPIDRVRRSNKRTIKHVFVGLGEVTPLDETSKTRNPQEKLNIPTEFNIYIHDKATRNIKFRVPEVSGKLQQQQQQQQQQSTGVDCSGPVQSSLPDATRDFQYNLEILAESGFDVKRKHTIIMIHGYRSEDESDWARAAKDLWLQLRGVQVNVITVNWPAQGTYPEAVSDTVFVARQLIVFLHYLAQLNGTSLQEQEFLDKIHLIGHSLGAHIAAFVGQDLGGRVGRITGLDPAGPTFDSFPENKRLDRADAQLVEILHTNAGKMNLVDAFFGALVNKLSSLFSPSSKRSVDGGSWFGIDAQLGHLDYYANNGRTQEGCTDALHVCDHGRAHELYVDVLKYELSMRKQTAAFTGVNNNNSHDATSKYDQFNSNHRLWAFRAPDYESFQAGAPFNELCPNLMEVRSHLRAHELAYETSFKRCAVPLLDFTSKDSTLELIRELRDEFGIIFGKTTRRDRFYFRTQKSAQRLVGDHYLLKLYLDRDATQWDSSKCLLNAKLIMADGTKISLDVGKLAANETILALPFAHPGGAEAHVSLQELSSILNDADDSLNTHSHANQQVNTTSNKSKEIARLVRKLFPVSLELEIPAIGNPASACQFAYKEVEVHPISVDAHSNLGVIHAGAPQEEEVGVNQLNSMSTSEFAEHLRTATSKFMNRLSKFKTSVKFGSTLVELPLKVFNINFLMFRDDSDA